MTELAWMDATAQAQLVRDGEATPRELVDGAIERIEQLNPELNAVITPTFEKARAAADKPLPNGPFTGVPFLVKDLICTTEGDPYYAGTRVLKDIGFVAPHDSYLATKFRQAGFVFCGKTNTPEFGTVPTTEPLSFGPSRNPWNTGHSTGGSSGGSAAAVASGMVPVAHANDGGGSIRIPSSECGLVGLKPSRGRTSQGPDYGDQLSGFVNEHVVARSVRDTAAVLDAVHGWMPGDPFTAPAPARPYAQEVGADPGTLKIGMLIDASNFGVETHPDCIDAVNDVAGLLRSLGHEVDETAPSALLETEVAEHATNVWSVSTAHIVKQIATLLGRDIKSELDKRNQVFCDFAGTVDAVQYYGDIEWMQVWTRRVEKWWADGWDILITPTISCPPPKLGEFLSTDEEPLAGLLRATQVVAFTQAYNITGQPAMSLPLYWNKDGLPIGVQFVAGYGREDVLIRLAAQLEKARPWADKRPAVCA